MIFPDATANDNFLLYLLSSQRILMIIDLPEKTKLFPFPFLSIQMTDREWKTHTPFAKNLFNYFQCFSSLFTNFRKRRNWQKCRKK